MSYFAKEFIETAEGLLFAVVLNGSENDKVLCFLRYVVENGVLKKCDTNTANQLLKQQFPDYLYFSPRLQAKLHAVPIEKIVKHHKPQQRLSDILHAEPKNSVQQDCIALCQLFDSKGIDLSLMGITGSLLVGAENAGSDIDLVCYDKIMFHQCRSAIRKLIAEKSLKQLLKKDWQDSFKRRDCELDFDDYVWHEKRKCNKALINGRKFDLSLLSVHEDTGQYKKCGTATIQARVSDDSGAFDYPAEYKIFGCEIKSVVSFTATYIGQAKKGELIEAQGQLEENQHGVQRLVIGSSREAKGEYIRVFG